MGNINLFTGAIRADLGISFYEGILAPDHTFRDGRSARITKIGGQHALIHRQVPAGDLADSERGRRLMRGQLIQPAGKKPFWGQLQHTAEEAYVVLLAPMGAVSFDYEGAVAAKDDTETLDVFLLRLRAGPAGGVQIAIRGDDGRRRTHSVTFEQGELCTEELS